MQCIILAAGYATRLHPLTLNQPKPLLPIAGTPIIDYLIDKIDGLVDEIFVVSNNQFYPHFFRWRHTHPQKNITIVNDMTMSNEHRLGSIGDIHFVMQHYNIHDDVLILGGDNLFNTNLTDFISLFKEKGSSIMLNDVKDLNLASLYGIVSLDGSKITQFVEKPNLPQSTLASTLVYAIKKEHLHHIPRVVELGKSDRAGDFIAHLVDNEEVHGYVLDGNWFDIGSLDQLNAAENFFTSGKF